MLHDRLDDVVKSKFIIIEMEIPFIHLCENSSLCMTWFIKFYKVNNGFVIHL